jgi:hypothetical protein
VWGIGESKWGGDFRRRMMVITDQAGIWEWKEQEEIEFKKNI